MAEHNGGNRGGKDRGPFRGTEQLRRRSAWIPLPRKPGQAATAPGAPPGAGERKPFGDRDNKPFGDRPRREGDGERRSFGAGERKPFGGRGA